MVLPELLRDTALAEPPQWLLHPVRQVVRTGLSREDQASGGEETMMNFNDRRYYKPSHISRAPWIEWSIDPENQDMVLGTEYTQEVYENPDFNPNTYKDIVTTMVDKTYFKYLERDVPTGRMERRHRRVDTRCAWCGSVIEHDAGFPPLTCLQCHHYIHEQPSMLERAKRQFWPAVHGALNRVYGAVLVLASKEKEEHRGDDDE
jgi:hypothetical protein